VNTDTTAAERRAKAICVNYHKRFKKLDEVVFASDVVGEMEPPGLYMGLFKASQGRFLTGQVIPRWWWVHLEM
jgi:hypothetical protein